MIPRRSIRSCAESSSRPEASWHANSTFATCSIELSSSCYPNQRALMPSLPKSLSHICVALGFPSAAQLARAAEREYKDGNTFLEFRLDYLPDPAAGIEVIR